MRVLLLLILFTNYSIAQTWDIKNVGVGIKPSLVVDDLGNPTVAYMTETGSGYIRVGQWKSTFGYFDTTTVATGYFYGPLDITLDLDGFPHIVTHDHNLNGGDLKYSFYNGTQWINQSIFSDGHDGWDADIKIDGWGKKHVISVDPSQFGSTVGLEYAYHNGFFWTVDTVGSLPLKYANALSMDIDSLCDPHITYYDDINQNMSYVYFKDTSWIFEKIDSVDDAGRFSSLMMAANSIPHVSYTSRVGNDTSLVKFAWRENDVWASEVVDTLFNLEISGGAGARKSTAIQINDVSDIKIAYCDKKFVKIATRVSPGNWTIETMVDETMTSIELGQQIDFVIDKYDLQHLTYYERSASPSPGIIKYLSNAPIALFTKNSLAHDELILLPTISNDRVNILGDLKSLSVYNSSGVPIIKNGTQSTIDVIYWTSGIYLFHLTNSDGSTVVRRFIKP